MKFLTVLLLAGGALLAASLPLSKHRETAVSAEAFVDSVGVSVHLHYTDTPYSNFAAVESALKALGTRHIRDGLIDTTWTPYYERLNELGKLGIRATLVTSPNESERILADYPRRVASSLEAYEAPNEYDQNHGPDWAATLNAFVAKLYKVVKSDPALAKFPIVGPSLTQPQSFPKTDACAEFFDYANVHNYPGGRNPGTPGWGGGGYGSIEWNLDLARRAWPGKPIITTETGYQNNVSKTNGVPEEISAKYLPRLFFEQWMHGIRRTYVYELVDLGGRFEDNTFGLLHSDFSPKAGYNAISSLLHLLSDPGPEFRAGDLDFELSGNLTNVHHLLLEKRNGTYYLAIWIEQLGYDVDGKKILVVPEQSVTVQMKAPLKMTAYRLDEAGRMKSADLSVGQAHTLEVSDRLSILEISR